MRHMTLLPIAAVLFFMGCAETRAPSDYPDAVTADPAHYSVEFENDAVRLLRVRYGPGEESVMHYHPAICSVALGEASWKMTDAEGAETESTNVLGEVECNEENAHLPENTSSASSEVVLIEFKEGATAGTATWEEPDAPTADPDHYSVEFENDVARLIRIQYEPGDATVMHRHPANCIIWITAPPPSGEVEDVEAPSTGLVNCQDSEAHTPEGSSSPIELVLLELKGRETFEM